MSSEKVYKIGIAGYGLVGKRRHKVINEFEYLKVTAVCDKTFKESCTLTDGTRCYNEYKKLLSEDLDALFVCLPNYLAPEVTIAGLKLGLHVFCEKPPGRDVADIEHVIAVEKEHPGLFLKYGFNHRYHDSVCEALKMVRSGKLGEIINIRGVYGKSKIVSYSSGWRAQRKFSGGGILLDQGIHMVDLLRLFCGDFVEVNSHISNSYWKHDVEDNAYALLKDANGRIAILHSSATQWQHRFSLDITLTNGFLCLEGILSGSKSYGEERLTIGERSESDFGSLRESVVNYLEDHSWRREIEEFADAIINKTPIVHGTSREALETMCTVFKIYYADPAWREKYNITDPMMSMINHKEPFCEPTGTFE